LRTRLNYLKRLSDELRQKLEETQKQAEKMRQNPK